jgi:hypothetical protein
MIVQSYINSTLPEPPPPARTSNETVVLETTISEPTVFDPHLSSVSRRPNERRIHGGESQRAAAERLRKGGY